MVKVSNFHLNNLKPNVKQVKKMASKITGEIKNTAVYYKGNFMTGWNTADRLSKIKKYNSAKRFFYKFYNAFAKTKIKNEHIPTILGSVGLATPLPGASLLGYGLGKIITSIIKKIK